MSSFEGKVYLLTKKIPRGKVSTYKEIARALGNEALARAVGNILKKNFRIDIPCHRVIKSDGRIGGYNQGWKRKIAILRKEGVEVVNRKIDLKKYFQALW